MKSKKQSKLQDPESKHFSSKFFRCRLQAWHKYMSTAPVVATKTHKMADFNGAVSV
jgi:hypothetical protein